MQTHQLTSKSLARPKKRIGRGGKRGTYSGHGGKGQTARSGRNFRPIIREVLKRYPKLRGYRNHAVGVADQVVCIRDIETNFESGKTVSPRILTEKNLVSRVGGQYPVVKIVDGGDLTKKLVFRKCAISKTAKEKIEKAGGTIR